MKKPLTFLPVLVPVLILALSLAACGNSAKPASTMPGSQMARPDASQMQPGSTPAAQSTAEVPAVTVKMPENLKLTYSINGDDTRTVIKIGDDYYSCYMQYGTNLIDSSSFFFRHNSDGTWTQYTYNFGWQPTSTVWEDPADGVGGLKSSYFYWHVLLEADYIGQYGAPVESTTVLSRPAKVYEGWVNTIYYVDDETGLVIKGTGGDIEWEIVAWDTTVTDFGDVQVPA